MAAEVAIGGSGVLFVGEDKTIRLEVLDENGLPVDTALWVVHHVVAKTDKGTPIVTKVTTVTGVFNVVRATNTQRRVATYTDTDMNLFKATTYRHSWKRMDGGSETVLAYGDFAPQKATAP